MSRDEKLAQLGSIYVYELLDGPRLDPERATAILSHGIGQISRIGGASALPPAQVAALANAIQTYLVDETRLGIPAIVHEECLAGYMSTGATSFPQGIGMAATWDPDLAHDVAVAVARQLRSAGAHQGLAPVLDVCRDPRWGRVEETAGEDPYLVAAMGVATVRGLQAGDETMAVVATAKHFAGHGVPEGGMNSAPPHIGPRELREVFLPPFEAAVRVAGVTSFMHAYHEIDGIPCIANRELLVDTLRGEWAFAGTLVSDYNGIEELAVTHRMAADLEEAAAIAIEAGVDVELPSTAAYGAPLQQALESGRVDESDVDRSVARVLRQKFELGLFENALVASAGNQPTGTDRALAHRAAQRSLVLLENEATTLPLSSDVASIAVVGPTADDPRFLLGDYSQAANLETMEEARGAADEFSPAPASPVPQADLRDVPSVLEAIIGRVGPEIKVSYAAGCGVNDEYTGDIPAAVAVAADADVAIVVAGGRSGMTRSATSGEFRDRTDLGLPGAQQQLLDAVTATGTPVVLILLSGRPLSPDLAGVRAVLHAWLPGAHGAAAVAGALFGDFSPGGKLPITVPRHVGQIPIYHGHKPTGGGVRLKGDYVDRPSTPRYPFGFGLSYTTFEVTGPKLAAMEVPTDGSVSATVHIVNTGDVVGDEVVQIYARRLAASVTRPVRELVGFTRIALDPGEERTLTFHIPADLLGFIDRRMRYVVAPGPVTISAGTSAVDFAGTEPVELVGATIVAPERSFFSSIGIG